jgi:HEAT repeat protein
VTSATSALTLSAEDRGRVEDVQRLVQEGAASVGPLLGWLGDKSWAVRRAVVAALARIGTPAIEPLCGLLEGSRSDESLLAAAVDTLVQASGDVESAVLALAERSTVAAVICDAAQILGRRKGGRGIPLLAKLSVNPDDNVAVAAIEALGRIGGTTAIEPLISAVRTRNFFRTFPAIEVLGNSGDPRVIAPLAELLLDPIYAAEAASALGRTAQIAAVAPLAGLLFDPAPVVGPAVRALAELRDRYAARFVDVSPLIHAFRERIPPEMAATQLLAAIERSAPQEIVAFACVLGWVKDPRVVTKLVDLLDAEPAVAAEASKALRAIGPLAEAELLAALRDGDSGHRLCLIPLVAIKRSSVPVLLGCLHDDEGPVRSLACEALGRIGDTSAVPPLFAVIGDPDARVSQSAVAAIQSLGSAETEALAISAASSGDLRTRRAALRIISYFGYPAGLEVLLSATTDENDRIRDAATQGLAFIDNPRALDGLFRLAEDSSAQTRATAMRALGQTSTAPAVVAMLRSRLVDPDAWVRYYACQALSRLGARECVADVSKLTEDPAGQVRVAAVEATARIGGPEAHLALARAAESNDPDVRRAALTGLGSMKRVEALPVFLRALASEDAATRLITLSALQSLDVPEAFEAVVRATQDPDGNVRSAALTLMEQRSDSRATHWLMEQLRDESRREWALRALAIPGDHRLEDILTALETADAVLAPMLVMILTRMQRADGNAAVVSLLGWENVFARRAAASALVASSTAEAREVLAISSKADSDDEVRKISSTGLS